MMGNKKNRYYVSVLERDPDGWHYVTDCVEITRKAYKAFLEQGSKNIEKRGHESKSKEKIGKPKEFATMKDDVVRRYTYMCIGTASLYVWEVSTRDD